MSGEEGSSGGPEQLCFQDFSEARSWNITEGFECEEHDFKVHVKMAREPVMLFEDTGDMLR